MNNLSIPPYTNQATPRQKSRRTNDPARAFSASGILSTADQLAAAVPDSAVPGTVYHIVLKNHLVDGKVAGYHFAAMTLRSNGPGSCRWQLSSDVTFIDTRYVGRVLSEQFITIRSASGHRTFRIGSGLLVSAIAASFGLLVWTAFSTGMAMWHLAGVDEPGNGAESGRVSQADLLGSEIARLEKVETLLEDQHSAMLLALRDSAGRKATSDSLLAELEPSGQVDQETVEVNGGGDHVLLALNRTVDELVASRRRNEELEGKVQSLQQESRRVKSVVLRLAAAISSATERIENELARLDQSPENLVREIRGSHAGRGGWLDEIDVQGSGPDSASQDRHWPGISTGWT